MTADEARALTDQIRTRLEDVAPLVERAYLDGAWSALGYATWSEYVQEEFGGPLRLVREDRQVVVGTLRSAGLSTRAIGTALGVHHRTVEDDLSGGGNAPPATVVGTDGKRYPATRPSPVVVATRPVVAPTPEQQWIADTVDAQLATEMWFLDARVLEHNVEEGRRWAIAPELAWETRSEEQRDEVRRIIAHVVEMVDEIKREVGL